MNWITIVFKLSCTSILLDQYYFDTSHSSMSTEILCSEKKTVTNQTKQAITHKLLYRMSRVVKDSPTNRMLFAIYQRNKHKVNLHTFCLRKCRSQPGFIVSECMKPWSVADFFIQSFRNEIDQIYNTRNCKSRLSYIFPLCLGFKQIHPIETFDCRLKTGMKKTRKLF